MSKIKFPPVPRKGQTVYKHKTETVTMGGKVVPRYTVINDSNVKKLPSDYLKDFVIYQRFGQNAPGTPKVTKPPVNQAPAGDPHKNETDAKDPLSKQKEQEGKGDDGKEAVGQTETGDKKSVDADKGAARQSEKATSTPSKRSGRKRKRGNGDGAPTVAE